MIFFLGIQGIYFGMKSNGSALLSNSSWGLVKWLHGFITYGTLIALGGAFVLLVVIPFFIYLIPEKEKAKEKINDLSLEEIEEQKALIEQERIIHQENERKKLKEQKKIEELKQKQIIEAKRNRSSEDAVRSALDDFL